VICPQLDAIMSRNKLALPAPANSVANLCLPIPSQNTAGQTLSLQPVKETRQYGNFPQLSPQKRPRTNHNVEGPPTTRKRSNYSRVIPLNLSPVKGIDGDDEASVYPLNTPSPNNTLDAGDNSLSYSDYLEYALAGAAGVYRLEKDLFIVQGWDGRRKTTKVSRNSMNLAKVCHFISSHRILGTTYIAR